MELEWWHANDLTINMYLIRLNYYSTKPKPTMEVLGGKHYVMGLADRSYSIWKLILILATTETGRAV